MSELSLATARPLFVDCHEGINHICFSPDGARQAISDVRMRVQVFEGDQAIFDHNFTSLSDRVRPTERVRGLGFCPASETLFVIAGEAISAIDTREGAVLWDYVPPRSFGFLIISPSALATSRQGELAVSFDNGSIGVWDASGHIRSLWRDNDAPRYLGFSPDGSRIFGTDGFSLCAWDAVSRQKTFRLKLPERVFGADFHPNRELVATRGLYSVLLWDMKSGKLLGQVPVHGGLPIVAFHPKEDVLLVADKYCARVFDFHGNLLRVLETNGPRVVSVAFHPSGESLFLGCDDRTLMKFELN
ncbi:MAG: WD40 repeat domain-containing protein [Fimbriimonas sp.]